MFQGSFFELFFVKLILPISGWSAPLPHNLTHRTSTTSSFPVPCIPPPYRLWCIQQWRSCQRTKTVKEHFLWLCQCCHCHYSLTYCSLWSTRSWSACVTDPDCVKSKNVICTMLCGLSRCVTRTASTHVFNIFSPGEIQICMIFKNRFTNDFFFSSSQIEKQKEKIPSKIQDFCPSVFIHDTMSPELILSPGIF